MLKMIGKNSSNILMASKVLIRIERGDESGSIILSGIAGFVGSVSNLGIAHHVCKNARS